MEKIIKIPHKICDYTCMWNGIEDQYEWKTNNRVPDYLFFGISAFCSFIYIKQSKPKDLRAVFWSNGLTKKMYNFMQDIIGYDYKVYEGKSFDNSLIAVKKKIDNGMPVVLGALDMFYLPYYDKYYKKVHIPIHYVLMVGYDDLNQNVIVLDCGKENYQKIPYSDLQSAWNVNLPVFSKPNTYFTFSFDKNINTLENILHQGLKKKCAQNLNSSLTFIGINGIKKLAKEFPKWEKVLTHQSYLDSLMHFVEYTGFPPMLSQELVDNPSDLQANHKASRDKFAELLIWGSNQYNHPTWKKAADLFFQSGLIIESITSLIMSYIKNNCISLSDIPSMLNEIAIKEEQAYIIINNSLK
jgi:hypothetical protein